MLSKFCVKKYFHCAVEILWFRRNSVCVCVCLLLVCFVNDLNCAVEIERLVINDSCADLLRDRFKLVFSPVKIPSG